MARRILLGWIAIGWAPVAVAAQASGGVRFEVSVPASVRAEPLTGRIFIGLAPSAEPEPRIAAYNSARQRDARVPFFAIDVDQLRPGGVAVIDRRAIGFPYESLAGLPAGDYYVQAIVNVYTRFARQDGRTVWAHMDQWEGQRWAFSPGNLYSETARVRVGGRGPQTIRLRPAPHCRTRPDLRAIPVTRPLD